MENVGDYDTYSEIITISPHQKDELSEILNQTIEEYFSQELDEEDPDESLDFMDSDVFLLSDDDDEDEDDDENY